MGAVIVGLDAHDLPERIGTMVEQADVAALAVADRSALSGIDPGRLERLRFILPITPDNGAPAAWPVGVRVISWGEVDGLAKSLPSAPGFPSPDDDATIIFTSGTTGAPKGIAYTHGQLCLAINAICEAFGFVGPGSRLLCWLPLSNLFQRIVSLAGMKQGAATYLLSDPRRVMQVVAKVSPDVFVGVPASMKNCMRASGRTSLHDRRCSAS
ncbi:MAG: AMP-binding protein [Ideonella sp.]|nr:AMP-binding protein [Ideonella sp.]